MASMALFQTRSALSGLWKSTFTMAALLPAVYSWQKPFSLALPTLPSLLELIPPIILAVPKKKVSHSRKAMRSAHKGLQDKQNIVHCPGCGEAKLAHHACRTCYDSIIGQLRRDTKKERRS